MVFVTFESNNTHAMPALHELESMIRSRARRSSKFKIGKTGQHHLDRLTQHSTYKYIEVITWSKYKEDIEYYEDRMIERFIDYKNNKNKNEGSAGDMGRSDKYILYVVYS